MAITEVINSDTSGALVVTLRALPYRRYPRSADGLGADSVVARPLALVGFSCSAPAKNSVFVACGIRLTADDQLRQLDARPSCGIRRRTRTGLAGQLIARPLCHT